MLSLLVDRPRLILALLAISVGFALAGLPRLEIDFTPRDLFRNSVDSGHASDAAVFGSRDNIVLIMVEAADVLDRAVLQYIHDASRFLKSQPYAARVDSLTVTRFPRRVRARKQPASAEADTRTLIADFMRATLGGEIRVDPIVGGVEVDASEAAELRAAVKDAPLLHGKLISRDQQVAAVAVALGSSVERLRDMEATVADIDAWFGAHPPPAGAAVHITGQAHANASFARRIRADQQRLMPVSLLVCVAVLWFSFGSLIGVLLPLTAVLTSAGVTLGVMGWWGEPLNILNNITPLLVIVIGLSDSIHLLERYSVERASDSYGTVRRTLSALTVACVLTSLTDAIGFGSLWAASTDLLARFGITTAVGVMIALFVTFALVPPWLRLWEPRLDLRHRIATRAAERMAVGLVPSSPLVRSMVLAATGIVLVTSLWAASHTPVDTTMLGLFEPGDPLLEATKLAERKLSGVSPIEIVLQSPVPQRFRAPELLEAIDASQRWAEAQPGVLQASSHSDYLHEVWAVLAEDPAMRRRPFVDRDQIDAFDRLLKGGDGAIASAYISDDGTRARLSIELADIGSRAVLAFSDQLKAVVRRELAVYPDVSVSLGGNAYVDAAGINTLSRDLLGSFGQATLAIGISLLLLSRGLAASVAGVIASVLPQALVLLYMALRGIAFDAGTVMIFCISVGLAIDGSIHLLARLNEEERCGGGTVAILRRAVGSTAAATAMNGVTLVLGFTVLTLSEFRPLRQFGELSAVAVICSLLGTFVLMPTLLAVFGAVRARSIPTARAA
ncbi:MAG TPA: MMPL family transporter [Terriglobales bacterium]|nr:MMPL family transporter [Terriglobales bacterium]